MPTLGQTVGRRVSLWPPTNPPFPRKANMNNIAPDEHPHQPGAT
jgi:hypothetical protein